MIEFINVCIRSIQTGAIYASVAVGLNLTIAWASVFNFAHGESVMIGAMLGVVLWISAGIPVVLAAALAIAAAALLGVFTDLIAVRPLGDRGHSTAIVSTLGIALLVSAAFTEGIVRGAGASDSRRFPDFLPWTDTIDVGGVILTPARMFPIVALALMLVGVQWFLTRTDYGRALGTLADDRGAAAMRGLPVKRLQTVALAIGGALAASAGFAAGPVTQASVAMGLPLTIKGFVAGAIGGMDRISGAVAGGLALGAIEQFTAAYLDTRLQDMVVLVALIALLYVRPQGLLGTAYRSV